MDMFIEFAKYSEHKIIFETYEIALIYYLSALMEKQYNTTDIATAKKLYIHNKLHELYEATPFRCFFVERTCT